MTLERLSSELSLVSLLQLVRTSKPFMRDVTECSNYDMLLFGGKIEVIAAYDYVRMSANARIDWWFEAKGWWSSVKKDFKSLLRCSQQSGDEVDCQVTSNWWTWAMKMRFSIQFMRNKELIDQRTLNSASLEAQTSNICKRQSQNIDVILRMSFNFKSA